MPAVVIVIGEGSYGALNAMAERLADACENHGARVLRIDDEFIGGRVRDESVFQDVEAFSPDLFIGMNLTGIARLSGRWVPEVLRIPCLSWMVDHPAYFMSGASPLHQLRNDPNYHVACVDPAHLKFLERFYPKERLHFLPHASIEPLPNPIGYEDRIPAAVMTAGLGNVHAIVADAGNRETPDGPGSWIRRTYRIIQNTALADLGLDVFQQVEGMLRLGESDDPNVLGYPIAAFQDIESRLRQDIRRTLAANLAESGVAVDIYGDASWKNQAGKFIRYMGAVNYKDIQTLFSKYRYVLNPQPPQTRNGSHERVMDALSAGTIPITLTNGFYRGEFGDSIVHFKCGAGGIEMNLACAADYGPRLAAAQMVLARNHTWSTRAKALLERFCRC